MDRRHALAALGAGLPAALRGRAAARASAVDAAADAQIIDLCAQHVRNMHAYNEWGSRTGGSYGPLWDAYISTLDAIDEAQPTTLAGLAAVARAAEADAANPNGVYDWRDEWVSIIVDGLLRLSGGAA